MPESIQCRVRFITPAFLGGADQSGQWRTPPFKALLREWWRLAASKDHGYNHQHLRKTEGLLFGHAWLKVNGKDNKTWAMQGQVRLRLDEWRKGQLMEWPSGDRRELHPEVGKNGMRIDTHLYLGFGPLRHDKERRRTKLEKPPGINVDDTAAIKMMIPSEQWNAISHTLHLIHWFGTVGGRSRNGWGSIMLEKNNGYNPPAISDLLSGKALDQLRPITRPLDVCLEKDWPHALGSDSQGVLLWKSNNSYSEWSSAMQELARVKIAFRTACSIKKNQDKEIHGRCNPCFDDRHLLAYPVTHHGVDGWVEKDREGNFKRDKRGEYLIQSKRLANQLRFKVVKDNSNTYTCLAYHLPCGLPESLQKELGSGRIEPDRQLRVWQEIHNVLDKEMQRITPLKEGGHDQ